MGHFQGFQEWPVPSARRAVVHMSEELQGREEMIERYRNSPLMHPNVSDVLRPVIYSNGRRVPFPEPTVPLKPPRFRKANQKKAPPHPRTGRTRCELGTSAAG